MPWYVTAYVATLIALTGMSWQMGNRLGWPAFLRNGDVLSALASIVLTIAYWHERWRLALGGMVVPIFIVDVAWMIFAIKPAAELGLRYAASLPDRTEAIDRFSIVFSVLFSLTMSAPALFWGFRVARAAVGF